MADVSKVKVDELASFQQIIKRIFIGIASFFTLIVGVHLYNFLTTGKHDQEAFAQFGDYIGGLLNPILGFSTVILLIYSIRIQAKELQNTTEELRLTREEMTKATAEAKSSANAMLIQNNLTEQKYYREDIEKSLVFHLQEYNKLLKFVWFLPQPIIDAFDNKLDENKFTLNQLINGNIYNENNGVSEVIVSAASTYFLALRSENNQLPISNTFLKYVAMIGFLVSSISRLIKNGADKAICDRYSIDTILVINNAACFEVIGSEQRDLYLSIIKQAVIERQNIDDSFSIYSLKMD